MPQGRHFGASSDTMQQVHNVGVKSNYKFVNFIPRAIGQVACEGDIWRMLRG